MKVEPWVHWTEEHLEPGLNCGPVLEARGTACKNTGMQAGSNEASGGSGLRAWRLNSVPLQYRSELKMRTCAADLQGKPWL